MGNARYLIYLGSFSLIFLVLTAIKMVLPHPEPEKPIDVIGMRLYKPIFFGETDEAPQYTDTSNERRAVDRDNTDKEEPEDTSSKREFVSSKESPFNDKSYLTQLIADYKKNVLSKRQYRNDVVVRYYRHEPDGNRAQILVEYGFYIHERPIPNTTRFKKFRSNIIYYGRDFPESDIKLIAALLINNGMEIKRVQPFQNKDGWKHKSIEIGANPNLEKKSVLTLSDIQKLKIVK